MKNGPYRKNHLQLLEERRASYFEALANVREADDICSKLSKVLAAHVGTNFETASWASEVFAEALALFLELADSQSKGIQ